jgi:hypothetical protein
MCAGLIGLQNISLISSAYKLEILTMSIDGLKMDLRVLSVCRTSSLGAQSRLPRGEHFYILPSSDVYSEAQP